MSTTSLITAEELATLLRVKPATIRAWSRTGRIPRVVLTPKVIRYHLDDVVQLLSSGSKTTLTSDDLGVDRD